MAIVFQEKEATTIEQIADGNSPWSNISNALSLDNNGASTEIDGTERSNSLKWSGFGFSFSEQSTLVGIEVIHSIVLYDGNAASVSYILFSNSSGNLINNTAITLPVSTSLIETVDGGDTDTWSVESSPFYDGISTINSSDFAVQNYVDNIDEVESAIYFNFGLKLRIYVDDPSLIHANDATAVRMGSSRVASFRDNGINYSAIRLASNFTTRSSSNFVLGGTPFSAYEDSLGNRAIAVYDASNSSLGSSWNISSNTYVYKGHRYSFLENSQYRLLRYGIGSESSVTVSSHTIWQGVPVSLDSSGYIVAKNITGTIDEVRPFTHGGTPLTAVRIGSDWAIAIGSV